MATQIKDVSSSKQSSETVAISYKQQITSERPLPPQHQVSLSAFGTSIDDATTSSSSCPDSPIRRVSSSLRSSAVGLATRFFRKCRAATFTLDGATYTIGKQSTVITAFSINFQFQFLHIQPEV